MSPERPDSISERLRALTIAARNLGRNVAANSEAIVALTRRAKLAERFLLIIGASVLFDFALTVLVGILLWSNYNLSHRLDTICPLYAFTLGTYAPQSRTAGEDRDNYVRAFGDMRTQFETLGCGPNYPIVPGAAHPPTAAPPGN